MKLFRPKSSKIEAVKLCFGVPLDPSDTTIPPIVEKCTKWILRNGTLTSLLLHPIAVKISPEILHGSRQVQLDFVPTFPPLPLALHLHLSRNFLCEHVANVFFDVFCVSDIGLQRVLAQPWKLRGFSVCQRIWRLSKSS